MTEVYQSNKTQSTLDFLAALFKPDDIIEFRLLPSRRQEWYRLEDVADKLPRLLEANNGGENVYFGVNPRPQKGDSTNESIVLAQTIFADFDKCEISNAIERVRASGLPAPTLTVASGHGLHTYWRLSEPTLDIEAWREIQRDLIALLASDDKVHDPARIMRLPGTMNHKEPAAPCEVLEVDYE
jgi:hypothetical protein